MERKIPIIVVCGPTATGKTELAVDIAERFGGEVVSADSMQIYKWMDIGTAKPTIWEMKGIPHHMIDIIEPDQLYSVSDYCADAKKCIEDIHSRGKLAILAGGTGLYIRSLVGGISFADMETDYDYRKQLYSLAEQNGNQFLHKMLAEVDRESAEKIHENNLPRIIRALEVFKQTGIPLSEHIKHSKREPSRFEHCTIGLNYVNRSTLYDKINQRVDHMISRGLPDEIKSLLAKGIDRNCTSMQAIGYKEFISCLEGNMTLDEAVQTVKQATRRYAKRQITWFSREEDISWLYRDQYDIKQQGIKLAEGFLQSQNAL